MHKAIFSHGTTRKNAEEKQKTRNNHVKVGGCATSIEFKKYSILTLTIILLSFIFFPRPSVSFRGKKSLLSLRF